MNRVALTVLVAALSLGLPTLDAEAKRLSSGGMKRSVPTQPSRTTPPTNQSTPNPQTPPQQQAAPNQQQAAQTPPAAAPTAAAAAQPKRSWMGPIAGLAAGLGLAALASHFGFGAALANVMTLVLLGIVAMLLIGFLMRRFGANKARAQGMKYAGAGAPFDAPQQQPISHQPAAAMAPTAAAAANDDGFDTAGFEQIAKRVFIRLQAANDNADQADLRRFTTPEMYGVIQQELLDRKGVKQSTEVLQLDAQVIDRAVEDGQQVVSVRFWGLIREQSEAAAEHFDEVWHLVRPQDESKDWAIAGIQVAA